MTEQSGEFSKCREITSKNSDFYDIDARFTAENIEKTALNYEKRNFYGRAGKQYVFLAAHLTLENAGSEKFAYALKKAVENYEKYIPSLIEKYRQPYQQAVESLKFLIEKPDEAFKAEIDTLEKTGKIK